ncbi:hypothetical protein HL670_01624 [Serratia plymuthica]|nr:hypothetical protein HL670_01624 [Serratia plymuthica]
MPVHLPGEMGQMGSFFKQVYRYSHSRPYRHNENLWPYVRIERAQSGEIAVLHYKKQPVPLVALSALKDSCQGPLLLTATGPSVNDICFNHIPAMPTMGVNGAYSLHPRVDFHFYVIVDMGFIDQRPDIIENIILKPDLILFTTVHGIAKIIDRFTLAGVKCRFAVVEDAAFKIYSPKITPQSYGSIIETTAASLFHRPIKPSPSPTISGAGFSMPARWFIGLSRSFHFWGSNSCLLPDWI